MGKKMIGNYDWLLFDADDTLFHFDAFAGLQRMFRGYNVAFAEADYDAYQAVNKPLWVEYQDGLISAQQLQEKRFTSWGERLNITPGELNSAFLAAMADICEPLPGAHELLSDLRGQVQLGIITNGFTELQEIRLKRTGLHAHFDLLVISDEVGVAKPDIAIFEHAFAQMTNPARNRILMVGDNPQSDIQGGLNAGIHTCWLNHHDAPTPEGIEPHYEVASLGELHRLLMRA